MRQGRVTVSGNNKGHYNKKGISKRTIIIVVPLISYLVHRFHKLVLSKSILVESPSQSKQEPQRAHEYTMMLDKAAVC